MAFRWRIRHKLAAGLVLVVGMTGVLSAGSFYGLFCYRRSNRVFDYHQQQMHLLGYLDQAISGLSFPSRDPEGTPADANAARIEKSQRLDRVLHLLSSYRTGLESAVDASFSLEGAQKQFAELDQMAHMTAELKESVLSTSPVAAANAASPGKPMWYTGSERDVIARLIYSLNTLRGVIHAEVTRNVEADRNNYRASLAIVYSTSVLVLGMILVLVWLGYRALFYPIRELHRGVQKLAAGNFDSRVHIDSGDEVEELGDAFNEMADRLQAIYRDLNRQVEERSRQLIRSERLASVGFLAAGVAHEINNPLASIAFCGEAIQSRLDGMLAKDGETAEVVRNYLEMIQQEAFRCKAITEKLLDFSRVGEPERVDCDLVSLVRGVLEMVQHLGRAKGRRLVYEPTEAVFARIHPQEIKQVLLNLVINGLESTDEGGTVWVETHRRDGSVEVVVADDGCGMTDEVLQNLFEPFFTRNRTGKGTGLGLSISHLIVSQHGGNLTARSKGPGRGSTFTVRLPAAGARSRASASPQARTMVHAA